jgi:hypothetical protein
MEAQRLTRFQEIQDSTLGSESVLRLGEIMLKNKFLKHGVVIVEICQAHYFSTSLRRYEYIEIYNFYRFETLRRNTC